VKVICRDTFYASHKLGVGNGSKPFLSREIKND
jgi:hypothetical protein